MMKFSEQVEDLLSETSWDEAARWARIEAVELARNAEEDYFPSLMLNSWHHVNTSWVECLVYVLMGMKGK